MGNRLAIFNLFHLNLTISKGIYDTFHSFQALPLSLPIFLIKICRVGKSLVIGLCFRSESLWYLSLTAYSLHFSISVAFNSFDKVLQSTFSVNKAPSSAWQTFWSLLLCLNAASFKILRPTQCFCLKRKSQLCWTDHLDFAFWSLLFCLYAASFKLLRPTQCLCLKRKSQLCWTDHLDFAGLHYGPLPPLVSYPSQ